MQLCEDNPNTSYLTNYIGISKLLDFFEKKKIRSIFISSSQVYDGNKQFPKEDEIVNPKNIYGFHKSLIEKKIINEKLNSVILRVSKIICKEDAGTFKIWKDKLIQGVVIHAATNIKLSPVTTLDLSQIIYLFLKRQLLGIWNISASNEISYYQAAQMLAQNIGQDKNFVVPQEVNQVHVPKIFIHNFACLNTEKITRIINLKIKTSEEVFQNLF